MSRLTRPLVDGQLSALGALAYLVIDALSPFESNRTSYDAYVLRLL